MKRVKEFKCDNCNTIFLRPKNRLDNGRINPEKLKFCDDCFKICVICSERHGKNGDACSPVCIKRLREKTNIEKYGSKHNWAKKHPGRISYQKTMEEKYGVSHNFQNGKLRDEQNKNFKSKYGSDNPFQVEHIKEKIKQTNLEKYGVENPKQNIDIIKKAIETFKKRLPVMRKRNEELGLWTPLSLLSERDIYYRNVDMFTRESLRIFGEDLLKLSSFQMGQGKGKFSIDHKFSKKEGFLQNIAPQIIGSIVNLEVMDHSLNSGKGAKCSITAEFLYNSYMDFQKEIKETLNEYKISKKS